MAQSFEKILSRPSMYLDTQDRRLHAGSIYQNLLNAVMFGDFDFGLPDYVDFTAAGPYFAATAVGCRLNRDAGGVSQLAALFDWQQTVHSNIPDDMVFLRPIVWFTQYCLVDFTIAETTYRQTFQNAQPVGAAARFPADEGIGPRISFCFTLPSPSAFESTVLDKTSLKRCLSLWQKWNRVHAEARKYNFPQLRYTWRTLSTYNYSVRITPINEARGLVPSL